MCLFPICICPLVKRLFKSFVHFLNRVVYFVMIELPEFSKCIAYDCFLNLQIFSLACLFIPLKVSFEEQSFYTFRKSRVSICSFVAGVFGILSKKFLPEPRSQRFSPMISSRSLYFQVLCLDL